MAFENFLTSLSKYLYDIVAAVIVLLLGLGLGLLVRKLLGSLLKEIELNKIVLRVNIRYDLERWISSLVSYVIYLVAFVLFLDLLGVRSVVLYLIIGAVLMLLVLTTVVGLKDIIPNLIGWLFLQKKSTLIKEGRTIEVKEISGVVERVGYLETEIRTEHGDVLYVPNALFLKSKHQVKQ